MQVGYTCSLCPQIPNLKVSVTSDRTNLSPLKIVLIDEDDAIDGVGLGDVIDKVPPAQVDGELAVGRRLLVNSEGDDHFWIRNWWTDRFRGLMFGIRLAENPGDARAKIGGSPASVVSIRKVL